MNEGAEADEGWGKLEIDCIVIYTRPSVPSIKIACGTVFIGT